MAYETVTGYCWPQSVAGGERVALHLSSSGVRPVDVEVAHIGATRTVVYSEAGIPAGDHPTPLDAPERGCGWPAASEVAVEPDWPSGYYEVILTIDVDGTARRYSRASSSCAPISNRRPLEYSWHCRRTRGTPTTTSAAATSTPAPPPCRCSARWRPAISTSRPAPASVSPRCIRPTRSRRVTSVTCG